MSFKEEQIRAMNKSELEERLDSIQKEHDKLSEEYRMISIELHNRRNKS